MEDDTASHRVALCQLRAAVPGEAMREAHCGCWSCQDHRITPYGQLNPFELIVAERLSEGISPYGSGARARKAKMSRFVSAALGRLHRKGFAGWKPGGNWYLTDGGRSALGRTK